VCNQAMWIPGLLTLVGAKSRTACSRLSDNAQIRRGYADLPQPGLQSIFVTFGNRTLTSKTPTVVRKRDPLRNRVRRPYSMQP
jgi:hypothetical protein